MTCREFADFMVDYLTNELPPEPRSLFERHLNRCPNCRRYLTSYKESIKLGKQAFQNDDAPVPEAVPDDLVRAILGSGYRTARRP